MRAAGGQLQFRSVDVAAAERTVRESRESRWRIATVLHADVPAAERAVRES